MDYINNIVEINYPMNWNHIPTINLEKSKASCYKGHPSLCISLVHSAFRLYTF